MPLIEQLRAFQALQGFTLQQLASIADECEEKSVPAGTTVFREKEESLNMIFLLEGKMEVQFHSQHIADVHPYCLVGEMGVIGNEPRSASLVTVTECSYLLLPREDFNRLVSEDNSMGMKFYRNICGILMGQLRKNNLLVEYYQALGQ